MSAESLIVRALEPGESASALAAALPPMVSEEWRQTFPDNPRTYGVFDGTILQAVLTLQEKRRMLVTVVTDPDLSPHCGLVFRDCPGNTEKRNGWHKRIMTAIADFLDRPRLGIVSVTFPDWVVDFQPFVWRGFKVLARYTYQIRLAGQTDETLLGEMNSSRRNEVRNGHKKDLTVTHCIDPAVVEDLVMKTYRRQGVSGNLSTTHAFLTRFARPSNSFAYVTCKGTLPVAVCFCIHDAKRAYYVLGGVDEEHGVAAASSMAMFACIRHARDLGLEVFDFEGSMVPGIEQYFRSFGGALTPLHRVVKASLPIEMAIKPFHRSLF